MIVLGLAAYFCILRNTPLCLSYISSFCENVCTMECVNFAPPITLFASIIIIFAAVNLNEASKLNLNTYIIKMKQIIFILAVLSYLCLSNKIDLYERSLLARNPLMRILARKKLLLLLVQMMVWTTCCSTMRGLSAVRHGTSEQLRPPKPSKLVKMIN